MILLSSLMRATCLDTLPDYRVDHSFVRFARRKRQINGGTSITGALHPYRDCYTRSYVGAGEARNKTREFRNKT
jgi:hypothetical protein